MKKLLVLIIVFCVSGFTSTLWAQFNEPEVHKRDQPRNLFDEGYKTGFGFNFVLNDFGFGAGGQFRFGLNPYNEALINFKIAGLKDPTEQTFIDYSFGSRTVPEKYRRAISIPLYVGLKKRFFAEQISDNFRVFSTLSAGPVFAFSYAYFDDFNDNGFRENDSRLYGFTEPVYDILSGWNEMKTHWGMGGEFTIGIDFGDNFSNLSAIQFGYTMNYFSNGIQILEPRKAILVNGFPVDENDDGLADTIPSHDPRKYFGSAQISFVFGWMW